MSRNIILGGLFLVWGLAIVIVRLTGGGDAGDGAYNAGQDAAFYFGFVMAAVGGFALRKGLRDRAEATAPAAVAPGDTPPRPLSDEEARERAREGTSVGPPTG
jgi:hypothetical protein